jgi:hypothetical protein
VAVFCRRYAILPVVSTRQKCMVSGEGFATEQTETCRVP